MNKIKGNIMGSSKKVKELSISNDNRYERQILADIVPLETPLVISFAPSNYCNLECIYCFHSSENPIYDSFKNKSMDLHILKKSIDDLKLFKDKVKAIHFCGAGEPLLNKQLPEMIKYTVNNNVATTVDLITNGIPLTKSMSDDLIASGVDFIRISVNGLSSIDFKQYTNKKIDFESFIDNITYLYNNKGKTKIYIKILNFMVESEERKRLFYKIFEPICDSINIEQYTDAFVDTKAQDKIVNTKLTQKGENHEDVQCCPQPFFRLDIDPEGNVAPCVEALVPLTVGNIKNMSLFDIWKSKILNNFRMKMLDGYKQASKSCANCKTIKMCSYSIDNIDSETNRLKFHYQDAIGKY